MLIQTRGGGLKSAIQSVMIDQNVLQAFCELRARTRPEKPHRPIVQESMQLWLASAATSCTSVAICVQLLLQGKARHYAAPGET